MIDCGELDWKVVAINANDPIAKSMEDSKDVNDAIVSG
jgi:inorganic pyrophosphatase